MVPSLFPSHLFPYAYNLQYFRNWWANGKFRFSILWGHECPQDEIESVKNCSKVNCRLQSDSNISSYESSSVAYQISIKINVLGERITWGFAQILNSNELRSITGMCIGQFAIFSFHEECAIVGARKPQKCQAALQISIKRN